MRCARIKVHGSEAVYHCVARAVAGEHLFGKQEKEFLRNHLRDCARFAGVQVLTYVVMANHYHLLVRIPPPRPLSDSELVERVQALLRRKVAARVALQLEENPAETQEGTKIRSRLLRQMHDVSAFLKLINQWTTTWFNKVHGRFGTLWAERFKSTLVGGTSAIQTVAAYIDLNPVRAGACQDPKDYRCCGYAEAVAGFPEAREGICAITGYPEWHKAQARYRCLLFGHAERAPERKGRRQASVPKEKVAEVFRSGGNLSPWELLRCRVRYFSDGLVLGTEEFVAQVIETVGPRTARARPRRLDEAASLGELRVLRPLRKNPVGPLSPNLRDPA